jgi:hypothetical protein
MSIVAETRESQETAPAKRPLGQLQAKIDAGLLGRVGLLAARRTAHEGRRVYPRDLIEEALEQYVPKAEQAFEKLASAKADG